MTGGQEPRPPEAAADIRARIGKYEVQSEIGKGTLVKLFRACDRDTGRTLILKVLTGSPDRRLVALFRRVVANAARLRHRNLITIYELGEHAGLPFAAMQDLEGSELRSSIRPHSPLSLLRKVTIMREVADGMRAAYHGGLTYVGVRPSGILLTDQGSAVIHDFSIVRLIGDEQDEDLSYAAPEELKAGATPDALCDVFSFGSIFYELLAGTHPFQQAAPVPLRQVAPECPEALERLVARAFEHERERRYQSMDEVLDDAEAILCELKRARAATLLVDARRMQRSGQIEQAQGIAREVIELDPANRKAREMHAGMRAEQQRRILQERLRGLFREADEEAAGRRFARAVEILNAAVNLAGASAEAKLRLDEMCARLERSQKAAQLLTEARQLLIEDSLIEALAKAEEARALDPNRPQTGEPFAAIAEAIVRRRKEADRQIRLQRELEEVRQLLAHERFADAAAKLTPLAAEFPSETSLTGLLEQARQAIRRLEVIANVKICCDSLRPEGQFEKALAIVDSNLAVFAADPALLALRHVIEQEWESFSIADATRHALDEAQWLLDRDRPHLAARFLREKCAELPGQPLLEVRLDEIEGLIPEWENQRFVQDCLGRAAAMEQSEQWAGALTLIDQALETSPASPELLETADRLRKRRREEETRKKLARRLEAIEQKIGVEAWTEAEALIGAAQMEFPGAPELKLRLEQARAGRRRADCESIAAEALQYLTDRQPEKAEEVLRKGMESLHGEPALERLWGELEAGKRYREQCRAAQVLFGRRQFREAEEILAPLADERRPEARALLDAVRASRAASEESDFYDHAREQALKLIVQRQFEQAGDLIRNLLNLFPGDPVLQRDLQMSEAGQQSVDAKACAPPTPPAAIVSTEDASQSTPEPEPEQLVFTGAPRLESLGRTGNLRYVLWPAIGASVLLFVAASGTTIWNVFHSEVRAAGPAREAPRSRSPKPISQPAPALPESARERGIRGPVTLEATVGPRGTIMQINILSGDPLLAEAAKTAVWRWRYEPGARDEQRTPMKVQIRLFDNPEGER